MKLPLISGAYEGVSKDTSSQELVNYFFEAPVQNEGHKGSLVPLHGASLFGTAPNAGVIRAIFYNPKDFLLYVVSGNTLYEVDASATFTSRGTLSTSTGFVDFALNQFSQQILIVDGTDGYIFQYGTNTFTTISDADFPGVVSANAPTVCAYIDGYFLVNDNNAGSLDARFRWSSINDGLVWAAADFATAESLDSIISQILVDRKNIYFFGYDKSEMWYHTEDPSAIFQRFEQLNFGVSAACSSENAGKNAQIFDNSLILTQRNKRGALQVVRLGNEYQPEVLSTPELSYTWQANQLTDYEHKSYVYQIDGHEFFVITFFNKTWAYDASTQKWYQRSGIFSGGAPTREKANCYAYCSNWNLGVRPGAHIVGDYNATGKLYEYRHSLYTFEGSNMSRRITGPQISLDSESKLRFSELQVDFNEAEVSTGVCTLYWSKNGGTTWSTGRVLGLDAARAIVHKPGIARKWTFRIVIDSAEKVVIKNLYGRMYGEVVDGPNTKR